jgi:hypothetical protein
MQGNDSALRFQVGQQADGSYVLRFEYHNLRTDVAVTRDELQLLVRQLQATLAKEA